MSFEDMEKSLAVQPTLGIRVRHMPYHHFIKIVLVALPAKVIPKRKRASQPDSSNPTHTDAAQFGEHRSRTYKPLHPLPYSGRKIDSALLWLRSKAARFGASVEDGEPWKSRKFFCGAGVFETDAEVDIAQSERSGLLVKQVLQLQLLCFVNLVDGGCSRHGISTARN
ncbi:hypothetical protein HDU87_000635 [Geranomyces variabilis]|uniref:Uncharacterized protein n=1 Tax=Geranomyces variabilis TaxID=109894 RepID=A0AAD5XNR7_9FUNG|nr:hypothetical protein HDU87_000635 [Geranomyces variabilis]